MPRIHGNRRGDFNPSRNSAGNKAWFGRIRFGESITRFTGKAGRSEVQFPNEVFALVLRLRDGCGAERIGLSQTLPAEQLPDASYAINLTMTITAL